MSMNEKTRAYLKYFKSLWGYKKLITAANLSCNAVLFSYQAANGVFIRQILNGLEQGMGMALNNAVPWVLAMAASALIRVIAIRCCSLLDAKRSYYYQNRTRDNAMSRILRQKDAARTAGDANRYFELLDDDVPTATFPAELLTEVGGFVIYTLVAIGILLSINWMVTLFIFIPLSAALYGVSRLSQNMKQRRRDNRAAHDSATAFMGDVTEAAADICMAGATEAVLRRYDRIFGERRGAVLKDTRFNERVLMLLHGSVYIGTAVMMLIGARLMAGDSFGIGDFSIFVMHLGTLANCVERIVELFVFTRQAEVSYERIVEAVCPEEPEALVRERDIELKKSGEVPPKPYKREKFASLEVRGLSYRYEDEAVFENVSFTLKPGTLAVVTGGVAAGKSTLLGLICGVLPPQDGEILYNGRPLSDEDRPGGVAGAIQRGGFFSLPIDENLRLGQRLPEGEPESAIGAAELREVVAEQGDAVIGGRGDKLSGGQRQRLALARALSRDSGVVVLDDCVSALDAATRARVLAGLKTRLAKSGSAAIIATNDPEFISAAGLKIELSRRSV